MIDRKYLITLLVIVFYLISCNDKSSKQMVHCVYSEDKSKLCKCPVQFDLADSNQLTHLKGQFYKSETGHLYNRTFGIKSVNKNLIDYEYFNGYFSQEVDPSSFKPLEGWFAKDKNYVYYFRYTSGGMQIFKLDSADVKTFKILDGHYKYAKDKNYIFDETTIVKNLKPSTVKYIKSKLGKITELISGSTHYKLDSD